MMIILLHSIQLAENLGAVARVMKNFCLSDLRLITPKVYPTDSKAYATAAGAESILDDAQIFQNISDATEDIEHLWGTCAQTRLGIRRYVTPDFLFQDAFPYGEKMGILFGCERSGLTQDDLSYCKGTLQISVNSEFSSMNLSHAVAIIASTHFKYVQKNMIEQHFMHFGKTKPASQNQKNALFNDLIKRLDNTHYWRTSSKKPMMRQNLANLFFRLDLTEQEILSLFGLFDALQNKDK